MRAWWLLVALCGCDVPFDLKQVPPPDGPPSCYSSASFGTTCRTVALPDLDDTYLWSASPTTAVGHADVLLVNGNDPAIIKFDARAIAANERIATASIVVIPLDEGKDCPAGAHSQSCASCPEPAVTTWQFSWMTSDWSSASVTYATRDGSTPWADSDRGPPVATATVSTEPLKFAAFTLEATRGALQAQPLATPECWIDNGTLSAQVTIADQLTIQSQFPAGCSTYPGPSLVVELCQ